MMTIRPKEIECHDLPLLNPTLTTTIDNSPKDCSDIKHYIQCPEYIHIRSKSWKEHNIRSNYGGNNHLLYSEKEWWMDHAITKAW